MMLVFTMIFGIAFLVIKGFEYHEHWVDMKVPLFAGHWDWTGPMAPPQFAHQAQILFCFYFFMTGFHAIHMLVGLGIMTTILVMARKGTFGPELLHAGRSLRPVLALRRYRVDFPVPACST